jgi:hypothetical protein
MREWIESQLKTGLPAFAGSKMSGTVAVKQELINELLGKWLEDQGPSGTKTWLEFGPSKHVVKHAAVRAEPGTVLVDFTIVI